jgi:hypothetical protein
LARGFELTEFVLLHCEFQLRTTAEQEPKSIESAVSDSDDAEAISDRPSGGIEVPGARLNILRIDETGDEYLVILQTQITEEASVPYELLIVTGSSFEIPEGVSTTDAASTLLFITYPYVREVIANITGRSPFQPFTLPPLTKLPAEQYSVAVEET